MRRDPKEYQSIKTLVKYNKSLQKDNKEQHPYKRKKDPVPGDDDYVEDVI